MKELPGIALVITTRDRKTELRRALASARAQDYARFQIWVYDDGSTDGTAEMVRNEFPEVKLASSEQRCGEVVSKSRGYIVLRNRGYREIECDWILSIDDDAWFTDPGTVAKIARQLPEEGKVAAFALPYFESIPEGRSVIDCKVGAGEQVRCFVGTAHICHRQTFLDLGGYHEFLVHQGEERDFCIRLAAAGYQVRMLDVPPIVHGVSPKRDLGRMHRWGTRNLMLFDFFYAPLLIVAPVLLKHAVGTMRYRFSIARAVATSRWLLSSIPAMWKFRNYRRPLTLKQYRDHFSLPNHGPEYLAEWQLPAPVEPIGLKRGQSARKAGKLESVGPDSVAVHQV